MRAKYIVLYNQFYLYTHLYIKCLKKIMLFIREYDKLYN